MSLYDKLEISKESTKDEIKKAFRKLSLLYHPDKNPQGEEKFKDISHAYEILSDDEKRKRYDLTGSDSEQPQANPFQAGGFSFNFGGGNPFEFMFNNMHNMHNNRPREEPIRKLEDTIHTVNISLKDAFFGIAKNLAVTTIKKCVCSNTCNRCNGSCKIKILRQLGPMRQVFETPCDVCFGKGISVVKTCEECKGSGQIKEKETFNLIIPENAVSGLERRITGKGQQPFKKSEIAGDLVFKINVLDDPNFKRRGNDFIFETTISFIDSICGCEITIPHFEKEIIVNTSNLGIIYEGIEYIIKDDSVKNKVILTFKIEKLNKILSDEIRKTIKAVLKEE
jgi:DnaJ-class molecular chaperone